VNAASFLGKDVDIVTPNGFEDSFYLPTRNLIKRRKLAREKLIKVSEAVLGHQVSDGVMFVAHSGRYEMKNKGMDVYIDSLGIPEKIWKIKK
jgi:glycogen phosphorylase/synthase